MLDGMPPGTLDQWEAFRQIELDPLERIALILRAGFAALCNLQVSGDHPYKPEHFDPQREPKAKRKKDELTPQEMGQWALATLPGARRTR